MTRAALRGAAMVLVTVAATLSLFGVAASEPRGVPRVPFVLVDPGGSPVGGATVSVIGPDGKELARGLSNYSAEQIDRIRGLKTAQIAKVLGQKLYDEVIHRNNMTLA